MTVINLCEAWKGQTKGCTVAFAAENHEMDEGMCVIFATDVCPKQFYCVKNTTETKMKRSRGTL